MSVAARHLVRWYDKNHRRLPWRETRDPYAIWISEVMLQQTQVAAVVPYYERFLDRWPTLSDLARADESDVLSEWSGLGYYSRARNLRRGAIHLLECHGGKFPLDQETLLETPGIGPYTAGAILSIAFDRKEPIVDGNVERVFARWYALRTPVEEPTAKRAFWDWADRWVHSSPSPRRLNQALMELGATVCVKGTPRCERCPIAETCAGRIAGIAAALPARRPRRKPVELHWLGAILESGDRLWLEKNPRGEWWQDLWDFPHLELDRAPAGGTGEERLARRFPEAAAWERLATHKHTVTHHRIHFHPYRATVTRAPGKHGKWWKRAALERAPVSALVKKVLMTYQ